MQNKLIYGLVAITAVLLVYGVKFKQSDLIERHPATINLPEKTSQVITPASSEYYTFERKVKAHLDNKLLADTDYSGTLIVHWLPNEGLEKLGRFAFVLKDQTKPDLFLEVTMTQDFRILKVKEPKIENAEQEDILSFTKDLVSIYAFQSTMDTAGKYRARIQQMSPGIWLKKKLQYEDPKLATLQFSKSIHQIKAAKNSGFTELSGVEETYLKAGDKGGGIRTHSAYLLKRSNGKLLKAETKTAVLQKIPLQDASVKIETKFAVETKINWEEVFGRIDQAYTLDGQERLQYFHELTKALKAHPEKLGEFAAWARAHFSDPKAANFAIGALATLGSPEAQKELVNWYQTARSNPDSEGFCHTILNAFATTSATPTAETQEFLASQMRAKDNTNLAMNAAFAVGAAIQRDPSSESAKELAEVASQARSINEKLAYLDAMGNSGSPQFLPQISENLNSPNVSLREKSVFALRYMDDERVVPLLENAMKDPELGIKLSAVKAISYQKDITPYQQTLNNCARSSEQRLKDLCSQTLQN